jgi:sugar phosphate isomerase/epimerase
MTPPAHAWPLAAYLTSLPLELAPALGQAAALGFTHVDVVAQVDRPREHLEALADAGVHVSCAALGRGLPPGHALDAADVATRRATLTLLRRQVADAARLGATCAYLVPGTDASPTALARFAEGCTLLADYAAGRMVRLCVEPGPGRAWPDAALALGWLERLGNPGLGLLLDVGHCLISGEDPAAVVRRAGPRLAYLHLDDNDGRADLHWPLLTGRLTPQHLEGLAAALREVGYRGGIALELSPGTPDPAGALGAGKAIAERFLYGG